MNVPALSRGIANLSPEQVQQMMRSELEGQILLIDVRESEEFRTGHIPGAKSIPLSVLETRLQEITKAPEDKKVFVCRSGGRSMRAAQVLVQQGAVTKNIYNLVGGMLAWNGEQLIEFPNLRAIDSTAGLPALLRQAIDLEKGTERLYQSLLSQFRGTSIEQLLQTLVHAERAHSKAVYEVLRKVNEGQVDDFETLYASFKGDLVESGESIDQAATRARDKAGAGRAAVLEFVLNVEWMAYDLYRGLAHQVSASDMRAALLELADQEKRHVDAVLSALADDTSAEVQGGVGMSGTGG